MKQTFAFSLIILCSVLYVNAQSLAFTGKVVDPEESDRPRTFIVFKGDSTYHTKSDKKEGYLLNPGAAAGNEVVEIDSGVKRIRIVSRVEIPNAYEKGDISIEIPNVYERDKDISVEIPNPAAKVKIMPIPKLAPKLLPDSGK